MNRSSPASYVCEEPWSKSARSVVRSLESSTDGLSRAEASRRHERVGPNQIRAEQKRTALTLLLRQLKSPLIIALIIAGFVSVGISVLTQDTKWIEAAVIFLAVGTNTALGFWQEYKAEESLDLLTEYTKTMARVRRGGKEFDIDAREIVPGDVVVIKQGDRVPADGRLVSVTNLRVDESALTGESTGVSKETESNEPGTKMADRTAMTYSGTSVVEGAGTMIVTAIGDETEFGGIASMVADAGQQDTPLQRSIKQFSTKAGIALFVMGALLFGLGYLGNYVAFLPAHDVATMFFVALAVIVSAVPEGLPVAVTVTLATGVKRLARRKGVVRKLLAAETLGSTSTIVTDKTGTLTQADMSLEEVIGAGDLSRTELLERAASNTDVEVDNIESPPSDWKLHGEPLETALVRAAGEEGISVPASGAFTDVQEYLPFNNERMYSVSAVSDAEQGGERIDILGAPEAVLERTDLDADHKQELLDTVAQYAESGSRIIALASCASTSDEQELEQRVETETFTYAGLLVFRDPIRESVKDAIHRIGDTGVRTVMATGDHKGTAGYVATELGLMEEGDRIIEGDELDRMDDDELREAVAHVRVFARVTPKQKVRILEAYQAHDEVVAVTGDGVNDAPALKTADIGVAMGSGTDVAQSASDLIILDDNFTTIVAAIEEGRKIMGNLRKVLVFLLSDSFDELILIGGSIIAAINLPLSAIQILFVKVFNDTLPALSFPFDSSENAFIRSPKAIHRTLFDLQTKVFTIVRGLFSALMLFAVYWGMLTFTDIDSHIVRTFIFATFSSYILFLVFSLRSLHQNIWQFNPFSNWYINGGVALGFVATYLAIYWPPLREIIGTTYLPLHYILWVLVFGAVNIAAMEFLKYLFKERSVS